MWTAQHLALIGWGGVYWGRLLIRAVWLQGALKDLGREEERVRVSRAVLQAGWGRHALGRFGALFCREEALHFGTVRQELKTFYWFWGRKEGGEWFDSSLKH